ncbi:M28 family metallopeptidase [Terricaulis sp.]|uniref:M28 family metallopeptidase n=1 Tax=Terricaulis sp. TaxID=2768686 RepID=UPI003783C3E5
MKLAHWMAAALMLGAAACTPTATSDSGGAAAASAPAPLSTDALMAHVRRLSSDEFEGRSPGTRGEELSIAYISEQFRAAGLSPGGDNGGWTQAVPMATAEVTNNPTLTLGAQTYAYGTDFVAWTKRQESPHISLQNAELVFVGYGIVAPENNWNDYAGVDVHGKIVVILINDPDYDTGDDRGFRGRAMTYYGRWTYKYEEAARQGAAGAIIIHEDGAAAYPWAVVNSSWTGPQHDLARDDLGRSRVQVEGWIQNRIARDLFQRAGLDFDRERSRAQTRGYRAQSLRARGSITLETHIDLHSSRNVIGVLRGAQRPNEAVIYGAHWDHLGRCTPVNGDDICNGALDNATGVAGLIELARAYSAGGAPQRSVAFIALTGEESGLLGSQYYAEHPTFEPANIATMINMDGLSNMGPARDIIVVGYGQSELDTYLAEAARAQGRVVSPEAFPERGSFYRSDHFNLAKIGVPTLYTGSGIDMVDGGTARGRALSDAYIASRYHKPDDEVTDDWDMSGATNDLRLLYAVGRRVADSNVWPQWSPQSEFRAARERSRAGR